MEAWEKTYLGQAAFGGWSQGTRHPRSGMLRERLAPIGILGELHVVTDIGLTGMGFTIIWLESIVALVFVLLYLPGDRPTPFHESIGRVKVWRCRAREFRARRESPVGLGCDRGREGWLSIGGCPSRQ